jgi:uncharacterized membrane protein
MFYKLPLLLVLLALVGQIIGCVTTFSENTLNKQAIVKDNESRSSSSKKVRDTLHDVVIDYVKALAEVFGWHVIAHKGREPGPDLVIEHIISNEKGERVDAVMFIESEVGHDQGGAKEHFEKVCKRVRSYVEHYKKEGVELFSLVIITNAPARLTKYLREHRNELREKLGFEIIEGSTIFIVPVLMVKEVMLAVFIRAFGAPGRFT